MKTVVSLFDHLEDARDVVEDLVDAGVQRDSISLVTRDIEGQYGTYLEEGATQEELEATESEEVGEAAAGGAVGGAIVGGLTGVLVGLGAFAIPGIGPVIAAGPIAAGLTGAALGAVTGGVLSALVEWGIPEEEAEYYAESVRRGTTLVAARVEDERVNDVVEIMEDYDPVDVEERVAYWRSEESWTGYDPEVEPYTAQEIEQYRRQQEAWAGEWEIDDTTYMEDESEEDEFVDDEDEYDYVVGAFDDYDQRFREHYDTTFATSGYGYNQFVPAYRYGYNLATDPRYRDRDWADLEADARIGWEEYNEGSWEDFKDAVRRGWEQVKEMAGVGEHQFDMMDEDEYTRYRPSYQQHYEEYYQDSAFAYDDYDSAYRYGYGLATYPHYRDYEWMDIEEDARQRWEQDHEGAWEEFKEAVRHGWQQAKRALS